MNRGCGPCSRSFGQMVDDFAALIFLRTCVELVFLKTGWDGCCLVMREG